MTVHKMIEQRVRLNAKRKFAVSARISFLDGDSGTEMGRIGSERGNEETIPPPSSSPTSPSDLTAAHTQGAKGNGESSSSSSNNGHSEAALRSEVVHVRDPRKGLDTSVECGRKIGAGLFRRQFSNRASTRS